MSWGQLPLVKVGSKAGATQARGSAEESQGLYQSHPLTEQETKVALRGTPTDSTFCCTWGGPGHPLCPAWSLQHPLVPSDGHKASWCCHFIFICSWIALLAYASTLPAPHPCLPSSCPSVAGVAHRSA